MCVWIAVCIYPERIKLPYKTQKTKNYYNNSSLILYNKKKFQTGYLVLWILMQDSNLNTSLLHKLTILCCSKFLETIQLFTCTVKILNKISYLPHASFRKFIVPITNINIPGFVLNFKNLVFISKKFYLKNKILFWEKIYSKYNKPPHERHLKTDSDIGVSEYLKISVPQLSKLQWAYEPRKNSLEI